MSELTPLQRAYRTKYGRGPFIAADAVVIHGDHVAIIRRRSGAWALPGGFVEIGETFVQAALRELSEEAGLFIREGDPLVTIERPMMFDALDRDPRAHIRTGAVFIGLDPSKPRWGLIAGDDAEDAKWVAINEVGPLYADHNLILREVLAQYQ